MLSGRNALQSINLTLQQLHRQVDESDNQIQLASDSLLSLQQQQTHNYRQLAKIRLDNIISGEVVAGLETADLRVRELLQQRSDALSALSSRLEEARSDQQQLEQQREAQGDRVAAAATALDEQETTTRRHLQLDPAYSSQQQDAENADRVSSQAEEKMQEAQRNREEKGEPYESDPLFFYLWSRGYGTAAYSANPLTRFLDKWVAKLCKYHAARPNYARLLEIPARLKEHADRQRAAADKQFEALEKLEQNAAAEDGIPALRQAHQEAEQQLDEIDDAIRQHEEKIMQLMQQKANYATGDDARFKEAIDTLAASLKRENMDTLYRYARLTTTAEDDLLVSELPVAEQRLGEIQQSLRENKRAHDKHLSRLADLEQVRRNFKNQRFDDIHSVFGNGATLTLMLNQFLQGLANSGDLWDVIRREQQYRPVSSDSPFGNRSIGRSTGAWRFPFPGGGSGGSPWGGGGSGGGGLGGGGGFHTGGGF
jgi:chromosome segregation ATPase